MINHPQPRRKIGIIDLVHKGATGTLYARLMYANFASIMTQVVAAWCEQEGHDVQYVCYTGLEDLDRLLPEKPDILFVCTFTHAALLAYALSCRYQREGTITVIGGPHARCYPEDASRYFDYVVGFTTRSLIRDILQDPQANRPEGLMLSASQQPTSLPGVQERWKFVVPNLKKAPLIKIIPMIGSMGCPYSCPFCIDANVRYQAIPPEQIAEDLKFIVRVAPWAAIAWHDPNFGFHFDAMMEAIESAAPRGSFSFIAETSLSLLTEKRLARLRNNGFKALLPGIESWFDMGSKSRSGGMSGSAKVARLAEHLNLVSAYIPYIQANFIFGLDTDYGEQPFELTREFLHRAPFVFPGFTFLTAYGEASAYNLELQQNNRILPFPFHFLNAQLAMNIMPLHYDWISLYDHVIDLAVHLFSWRGIARRFRANGDVRSKWLNVLRAISYEGFGRIRYFKFIRSELQRNPAFEAYFNGESTVLPEFYKRMIRKDLGGMWRWLPGEAMYHDHLAYLHKNTGTVPMQKTTLPQ